MGFEVICNFWVIGLINIYDYWVRCFVIWVKCKYMEFGMLKLKVKLR